MAIESWQDIVVPLSAALMGSGVGAWTTRGVSRQTRAHALYNDYLKRCLEHPELASHNAFVGSYGADRTFTFDPYQFEGVEAEKYQWFIALMLTAMEEIVGIKGADRGWRAVVRDQVSYHGGYFQSAWPSIRDGYSPRLQAIVDSVYPSKPNA